MAQDIDQLDQRPAVSDLYALCRALLLRGDRLAWLTLLRAPWCGLTLTDLHTLVADQRDATVVELLADQRRLRRLSVAGQTAVARVLRVLERAISCRGRLSLRALLEGTWLALGGPACYGDEALADAELFFNLVESLEEGAELPSFEVLEERLGALFAAVDASDDRVQIMTIHKAKGLQFDTVILPGLGKTTGRPDAPLLRWQQHPDYGLLLAPLAAKDSIGKDPLYQLIGRLEKRKQDLELARLLYVATTRAKSSVHLLGHAEPNKDDELVPKSGSLLEQLWPLVAAEFNARAEPGGAEQPAFQPPQLRRLPAGWNPPLTVPLDLPRGVLQKSASGKEDGEIRENLFTGWESESKRHIGTLVHHYLERIARFGVDSWRQLTHREQLIRRQLSGYGVPVTELDNGTAMVVRAVEQTVSARRGSWVLQPHQEHACELALTGLVDGDLVHAVIDRTFVADGVRWVVDYKTTAPGEKESLEHFFDRQRQQYAAQLQIYRQLFILREEQRPIRAALYFPLLDGWCEL